MNIELFIAVMLLFSTISQSLSSEQAMKEINKLQKYNIVYFSPSSNNTGLTISSELNSEMEKLFDDQESGHSTIESIRLDKYPKTSVIVGIGAFYKVFGIDKYWDSTLSSDTIGIIGKNVTQVKVGDVIEFGDIKKKM